MIVKNLYSKSFEKFVLFHANHINEDHVVSQRLFVEIQYLECGNKYLWHQYFTFNISQQYLERNI